MKTNRIVILTIAAFLLSVCFTKAHSQESIPRLFAYPQAPDTCTSLESRSNYVVTHFWDGLDLAKPIDNDASLLEAFRDYADVFKYAHRNVVLAGVRDFMFKLRSNSSNLSKIGRMAEAVLYGPQADYWSDEVYIEFAKMLAGSTVLKKDEREHYERQERLISSCQQGMVLDFDFVNAVTGEKQKLSNIGNASLIIVLFLDSSVDSSIDLTRLVTDVNVTRFVNEGQLAVVCLFEDAPVPDRISTLPDAWVKGTVTEVKRKIDVRMLPSCYLLNGEHKILNKNVSVAEFKSALEQ